MQAPESVYATRLELATSGLVSRYFPKVRKKVTYTVFAVQCSARTFHLEHLGGQDCFCFKSARQHNAINQGGSLFRFA